MRRRVVLLSATIAALDLRLANAQGPAGQPSATPWPREAFGASTVTDALARLGIVNPGKGDAVLLDAPSISPAAQPIVVAIETALPKIDQVALLADRLPAPLIALLAPPNRTPWRVRLTVHLPQTTTLRAYVRSEGQWLVTSREVKLAAERG